MCLPEGVGKEIYTHMCLPEGVGRRFIPIYASLRGVERWDTPCIASLLPGWVYILVYMPSPVPWVGVSPLYMPVCTPDGHM